MILKNLRRGLALAQVAIGLGACAGQSETGSAGPARAESKPRRAQADRLI